MAGRNFRRFGRTPPLCHLLIRYFRHTVDHALRDDRRLAAFALGLDVRARFLGEKRPNRDLNAFLVATLAELKVVSAAPVIREVATGDAEGRRRPAIRREEIRRTQVSCRNVDLAVPIVVSERQGRRVAKLRTEVDAGGGSTRLVAVEPGFYADGLVEVEAAGLAVGDLVVVP